MRATNKKLKKEKRLFLLFFRVVFAFVDAQLTLGFDAATFAAFLRLKSGASWKKGHLLQSVLILVLLSCHHPSEHWQSDCNHDYAEAR